MGVTAVKMVVFAGALLFAGRTMLAQQAPAQGQAQAAVRPQAPPPTPVQIVAVDECDPKTFNRVPDADPQHPVNGVGPDFCKNVALAYTPLGFVTTIDDLFSEAKSGHPDPNWDFEPDDVKIKQGTPIDVVNQGGEPHTFTEVKQFGGGFIPDLNSGQPVARECSQGFKDLAVARTRILQGSQLRLGNLSKGQHNFQC